MKISIWIDERQLNNLQKLLNKKVMLVLVAVMVEKSDGYYPCVLHVIIVSSVFVFLSKLI